jgi:hypothetical protein
MFGVTFSHLKKIPAILMIAGVLLLISFINAGGFFEQTAVHAQVTSTSGNLNPLELTINPTIVRPNKSYTARIQSFNTNLSGATIVWTIDGKVVASGVGKVTYEGIAPTSGKTNVLTVSVSTIENARYQRSVTLRPGDVDLTWYSDGITPPYYKGKASFPYQGNITFVAIPHMFSNTGERIDPASLIYTWTKNSTVLGSESGYGKQTLTVAGSPIQRPFSIKVVVISQDQTIQGEAVIEIEATQPEVLIYEESPLYGVLYNKAVTSNFSLTSSEVTYKVIPFSFSRPKNSDISYEWSLNNRERPELAGKDTTTLRIEQKENGTALVGLVITNPEFILQRVFSQFTINYTAQNTNETSF